MLLSNDVGQCLGCGESHAHMAIHSPVAGLAHFRRYRPRSTRTNSAVSPPGLPARCFGRKTPAQSIEIALFTSAGVKTEASFPLFTASRILRIVSRSIVTTSPARRRLILTGIAAG